MLDPPWFDGVFPSGLYILWSLCGHLQTSALHNHHESQDLLPACSRLLAGWLLGDHGAAAGFLWLQCHWPLHLWCCSLTADLLHRHQYSRAHELCFSCAYAYVHFDISNSLPLLHPPDNSENPLSPTKKKGFLNLLLPHDCYLSLSLTEAPSSCLWKHQPRKVLLWQSG